MSHPAWGVWIETAIRFLLSTKKAKSHPAWGVWIETRQNFMHSCRQKSHPAWGVWIETDRIAGIDGYRYVTPRMGCVD